jgi:DNA-binding MarR family transcriptional regulator
MDYLQFRVKRAHLQMVAHGRRVFAPRVRRDGRVEEGVQDMTPARFDLLFALHGAPPPNYRYVAGLRTQAQLIELLGLHKTTVSKMLTRLEELGLVVRRRGTAHRDKRRVSVALTQEGLRRIQQAFRLVFGEGPVHRCVLRMFTAARKRLTNVRWRIYRFSAAVGTLGRHFGDTAILQYPTPFPEVDR